MSLSNLAGASIDPNANGVKGLQLSRPAAAESGSVSERRLSANPSFLAVAGRGGVSVSERPLAR